MTRGRQCCKCGAHFQAEVRQVPCPGGTRVVSQRVCPACTRTRHKWIKRQANDQARRLRAAGPPLPTDSTPEELVARKYGRSRPDIARPLGITERAVAMAEQSMLRKLRSHRALRAAYTEFTADGCPLLVKLIRELGSVQREITLLDMQGELIEWWNVLETARRAGLTDADGLREATAAVAKSHALLAEKIQKGKL